MYTKSQLTSHHGNLIDCLGSFWYWCDLLQSFPWTAISMKIISGSIIGPESRIAVVQGWSNPYSFKFHTSDRVYNRWWTHEITRRGVETVGLWRYIGYVTMAALVSLYLPTQHPRAHPVLSQLIYPAPCKNHIASLIKYLIYSVGWHQYTSLFKYNIISIL